MHDTFRPRSARFASLAFGFLVLGLAYAFPKQAQAQSVYVAGSGNEFGTLDLATGQFTQTALLASTLYGLGFSSGGALYGVDAVSQLYQVNPASGAETLVGHIGPDSAFTATASGSLLYGLTGDLNAVFFSISPATQAVTELSTDTGITSDGLFASNGTTLYATSMTATGDFTLYRLTSSGSVIAVGHTGITDSNQAFGAGVFVGNALYGFNNNGSIYSFNTITGTATQTHPYALGTSSDTIYAATPAPASAPEPSAAATLTLGAFSLGALACKNRRRKASR